MFLSLLKAPPSKKVYKNMERVILNWDYDNDTMEALLGEHPLYHPSSTTALPEPMT